MKAVWIPLVIVVVIACGGYTVARLHGVFGFEKRPSYADAGSQDSKPFHPKQLIYEVFGPAGTVADISYFDINAAPRQVDRASLPWSLKLTTNQPAIVGN